jgi:large repetitive protein
MVLGATLIALVVAPAPAVAEIAFTKKVLQSESSDAPTSLQWGPDGRLYVAQFDGLIKAYTVQRRSTGEFEVTRTETIDEVNGIPNHDDHGTARPGAPYRLVTGLLVTGTARAPVVYVTSSDGAFVNVDTNSSMVSRLTRNQKGWNRLDLVRGLPRSLENHAANGLALDAATNTLYVAQGGHTNQGAPSPPFALLPEFAYSAAILSIDLGAIGNSTYDLPTLDDEDRPGASDANDPFGGNAGKNQARVTTASPVQVHMPGLRNPYDLVRTQDGHMFTIDNGGNAGWGGPPANEGPDGNCTNGAASDGGLEDDDSLHLVTPGGYGGHPNPTRANRANTFNSGANAQSPVPAANPAECDYRKPGSADSDALATFPNSTNGLDEYTDSDFGGAMQGDLIAAGYTHNRIYRIHRTADGAGVAFTRTLASNVGVMPLDLDVLGDGAPFPGTIWIADLADSNGIYVLEPSNLASCTAADDDSLDEDGDGFANHDEIANATSPCSAADVPPDADGDFRSDLEDPDDDNDSRPDSEDPFATDAQNGLATDLPVSYSWENGLPSLGGLLGLGFTGLMTNGASDYLDLFDVDRLTAGGAAGMLTLSEATPGDAATAANDQQQAFQFGIDPGSAGGKPFEVGTRIVDPFSAAPPTGHGSLGLFVGTGGQDDYVKVVAGARNGAVGVQADREVAGRLTEGEVSPLALPLGGTGLKAIDLYLVVDPATHTVQAQYAATASGSTSARANVGAPIPIPASWLNDPARGLAVGVISTSRGGATFPATWDDLTVAPSDGLWQSLQPTGSPRQEVSFVRAGDRMYLAGASTKQQAYDPRSDSWSDVADLPAQLDHIQGVAIGGRIYYVGGLEGWPEPGVGTVHIYDPATDTFTSGAPMPAGRERGAGGVAVHDGRIYYAGGLHGGAAVPWFDVYDPVADTWTQLPDMPTARDHFHAAVLGGRFYAIGGRDRDINATTAANEAYDFGTRAWVTGLTPLPTKRGGFAAGVIGDEIIVLGGEGGGQVHPEVEAYRPATDTWRPLAAMPTPRHGIQAATCAGGLYIAAGATGEGGPFPSDVHDRFFPGGAASPCVNTVPACADAMLSATAGRGVNGRLNCSDADGDAVAFTILDSPDHGNLTGPDAGGQWTYTPAPGFLGPDTFTYRASDGDVSNLATVSLVVAPPGGEPPTGGAPGAPAWTPPLDLPLAVAARLARFPRALATGRRSTIRVPVRCPPQRRAACAGRLELTTRRLRRPGGGLSPVTLARRRFVVRAGRTDRLVVRMTPAGVRLVRRRPRVAAWLTLIPSGAPAVRRQRLAVTVRRGP